METQPIPIRYLARRSDQLFLDEAAPAYFVAAEVAGTVWISGVVPLDRVAEAFDDLAKAWSYSGGRFYLYRRLFIGLDGEIVRVHDVTRTRRIAPHHLSYLNPWKVNTEVIPPSHEYELWRVNPDIPTRIAHQGHDDLDGLASALTEFDTGLSLGLQVVSGTYWHIHM